MKVRGMFVTLILWLYYKQFVMKSDRYGSDVGVLPGTTPSVAVGVGVMVGVFVGVGVLDGVGVMVGVGVFVGV